MPRRRWLLAALLAGMRMTGFGVRVSLKADGPAFIEGRAFARCQTCTSDEAPAQLENALARTPTNTETREILDKLQATSNQEPPRRLSSVDR